MISKPTSSGASGRVAPSSSKPGNPGGKRAVYTLFAIVVLGSALGGLSQTGVNAMMADIMADFGAGVELGQWLTTSYMLVLGITVPASTYLQRRFCTKTQVLLAFGLFVAGVVLDVAAPSFAVLLGGRILQAVAAGILLPVMQTVAMVGFGPGKQAAAMGIAGVALGFAPNIGPTVGGALSFAWGWRSFFALMLVLLAALVLWTLAAVRRQPSADASARLDGVSLGQSTLGFGGVLLGFSNASSFGLASLYVWVPVAAGALFLVLFVRRQRRVDDPLISMKIFRNTRFAWGFVAQCLLTASFMGITLLVPLYVQGLCGGTALDAGMVLLPGTVAALVLNPLAGVMTDRVGIRPVALVGGVLLVAGAVSMAFLSADTPLWASMVLQGVRACGVSTLIGPLTAWSLEGLPRNAVADGSAFSIASRQATASFGTSVMVLCVSAGSLSLLGPVAYNVAFAFSAAMALCLMICIVAKVR